MQHILVIRVRAFLNDDRGTLAWRQATEVRETLLGDDYV